MLPNLPRQMTSIIYKRDSLHSKLCHGQKLSGYPRTSGFSAWACSTVLPIQMHSPCIRGRHGEPVVGPVPKGTYHWDEDGPCHHSVCTEGIIPSPTGALHNISVGHRQRRLLGKDCYLSHMKHHSVGPENRNLGSSPTLPDALKAPILKGCGNLQLQNSEPHFPVSTKELEVAALSPPRPPPDNL